MMRTSPETARFATTSASATSAARAPEPPRTIQASSVAGTAATAPARHAPKTSRLSPLTTPSAPLGALPIALGFRGLLGLRAAPLVQDHVIHAACVADDHHHREQHRCGSENPVEPVPAESEEADDRPQLRQDRPALAHAHAGARP